MLRDNKDRHSGFQYVVEKPKPARVFFGSGLHRSTGLIGKGLSSFQRRFAPELNDKVTPQTYDLENFSSGVTILQNKVRSNKGVSGLASGTPQHPYLACMRVPSPTRYDPQPIFTVFKQNKVPFLRKVGRKPPPETKTPGPGNYEIRKKHCRRTRVDFNFGVPKMVPVVQEQCIPVLQDVCSKCNEICADDYWHINYTTFLCHICMEEEKLWNEQYKKSELKQFKKWRTCWHKHSHEGTTAAIQLMSNSKIKKKARLENYLDLYFSPGS